MRAVLLFALAVPLLAGAGDDARFDQNRRRIEQMSAVERARLERNFERFQGMTEQEREQYRNLDRQVRDDESNGGRLRDLMDGYVQWLATLSPYQRESIDKESDPVARAQLVGRIHAERRRENERPDRRPLSAVRAREGGWHGLRGLPQLASSDLDAVTRVLEEEFPLPPEEKEELEGAPPHQRHLRILKHAMQHDGPGAPRLRGRWPSDETLERLVGAIENPQQRRFLEGATDPTARRKILGTMIAGSLAAEWRGQIERLKPSDDELQKFFLALEPPRRDELLLLPQEEQRQRLAFEYASQKTPELRDLFVIVDRLKPPIRPRDWRREPDGRPGPPPDDRRGPPRGRRPGPPGGPDHPGPPPGDRGQDFKDRPMVPPRERAEG
ncbi:MAG: hypothetical protein AB7O26_12535 [Planctomycetaceae bacterium]